MDPCYGPLASMKCSELCAPIFKVVYNGVILGLYEFHTRGPCKGTMGSALGPRGRSTFATVGNQAEPGGILGSIGGSEATYTLRRPSL